MVASTSTYIYIDSSLKTQDSRWSKCLWFISSIIFSTFGVEISDAEGIPDSWIIKQDSLLNKLWRLSSLFPMLQYQDKPSYIFDNNPFLGTQDDWHLLLVDLLHYHLLLMYEEGHGHLLYPGQVQEGGNHKLQQATTFPVATDNSTRLDWFMEKDDHVLSHLLDGGENHLKFQHLTVFLGLQCFQI